MKLARRNLGIAMAVSLMVSVLQFSTISTSRAATSGSGICQQTYTFNSGNDSVAVVANGDYCYVAFKNLAAAGSAASNYTWSKPSGITSLDVLVIGGGGGGGARHGGGGGAGSFVQATSYAVSSASTNLTIIVGSGGAGAPGGTGSTIGSKGNDSSFKIGANGLIAVGGGAGVNGSSSLVNGGSGGGAGASQTAGTNSTSTQKTLDGTSTITGIEFGYSGATGTADPNSGTSNSYDYWAAGGGGGAGAAGKRPSLGGTEYTSSATFPDSNGSTTRGGDGGDGKISSIISAAVATSLSIGQVSAGATYFAAGGGGGIGADGNSGGTGGVGGGGNGTKAIASGGVAALVSTGSGGGGSGFDDISPVAGDVTNPPGGAGASGVVVIRFIPTKPAVSSSASISGTTTYGQALSSSTGSWIYAPTAYTYQWSRSSTVGGAYTAISGATSASYTLVNADVGQYLKVAVTATNLVGSTTDTSTASSQIAAASSSSSVSIAVGNIYFRVSKTISATPTVAGKLTFKANNLVISGCKNLSASANVAKNCTYRPGTRGYVTISVTLVPTDSGYSTATARSDAQFVYSRSGTR